MKKSKAPSSAFTDLRRRAEQRLQARQPEKAGPSTEQDTLRLVHELQVHQVELEMQNEEMLAARTEAEAGRERYTDLYDFAPIGYFALNEQGLILEANLTAAKLLGTERTRLVRQPLTRFIFAEDQDVYLQYLKHLLETHSASSGPASAQQECEIRMLYANSSPRWVQLHATVERAPSTSSGQAAGGAPVCRVVMSDIDDRRRIEGVQLFLSQCGRQPSSEGFFHMLARYLVQSLGMDYVCIDRLLGDELSAETVAVFNNGKFEDNIKYTLKDTPCGDVVDKTTCCFPRDVRRLFPKDTALQELRAESYVGTILWSYDGRPIGLIAVIGRKPLANPRLAESMLKLVAVRAGGELERKHAEDAREASHRQTLAILESIGDGFFSLDRQWRVTYVNERGARLIGKSAAELLGKSLWESFPGPETAPFRNAYERALAGQVPASVEAFFPPLNAWFEARAFPSTDGLSVFYQDITERKSAQKAIESLARFPEENPTIVLRMSADGTLAYRNPASQTLLSLLGGKAGLPAPATLRLPALAAMVSGQKQEVEFGCQDRTFAVTCVPIPDAGYVNIYGRDVTELRQAQAREREAQAAATAARTAADVLDAMGDGVALLAMDGTIRSLNAGMRRLLGRDAQDITGANLCDLLRNLLGQQDHQAMAAALETAKRGQAPELAPLTLASPSQGPLSVIGSFSFVWDRQRAPTAIVLTLKDITDLDAAHAETRAAEARLREAQRMARIGNWEWDIVNNALRASEEIFRIFGTTRADFGATYEALLKAVHPEDMALFQEAMDRALRQQGPVSLDHRIVRPDGAERIVHEVAEVILDDQQRPVRVRGTAQDITTRRQAEDRTRITSEILRLFAEAKDRQSALETAGQFIRRWSGCSCVGIRVLNEEGHMPYETSFGFSPGFLASESSLVLREDQCACVRLIAGRVEPQDKPCLTASGSFACNDTQAFIGALSEAERSRFRGACIQGEYASVAVVPLHYHGVTLGAIHLADERRNRVPDERVAFVEDIGALIAEALHRFDLEKESRRYQERLRGLAERLAATEEQERWQISRYIHDTIVQNLSLSCVKLGALQGQLSEADPAQKIQALGSARKLVEDAIAECRVVMSELTPSLLYELGLVPALTEFADKIRQQHGMRIHVEDDGKPKPLEAALRGLLFQCARELILNALKHAGQCEVRVAVERHGNDVLVRVQDDGKGFDPAKTEPRDESPGGFGLFSVRERIEGFGGRLDIQSTAGRGTAATIRLPVADGDKQEAGNRGRETRNR